MPFWSNKQPAAQKPAGIQGYGSSGSGGGSPTNAASTTTAAPSASVSQQPAATPAPMTNPSFQSMRPAPGTASMRPVPGSLANARDRQAKAALAAAAFGSTPFVQTTPTAIQPNAGAGGAAGFGIQRQLSRPLPPGVFAGPAAHPVHATQVPPATITPLQTPTTASRPTDSLFAGMEVKDTPPAMIAPGGPGGPPGGEPVPEEGGSSLLSMLNSGDSEGFSFIQSDSAAPATPTAAARAPEPVAAPKPIVPEYPSLPAMQPPAGASPLELLKINANRAVSEFWMAWKFIGESEATLKSEELKLSTLMRDSSKIIREKEDSQSRYVEAEDFEKAASINDEIEKLKSDTAGASGRLAKCKEELMRKESEKLQIRTKLLQSIDQLKKEFASLQNSQSDQLSAFIKTQSTELQKREDSLNGDFDRVERLLTHTKQDLRAADDEEAQIERSISNETGPFIAERDALAQQETTYLHEIEDLRRRLAEKEKQLETNRASQATTKARITSIRASFDGHLKSVADKKNRILSENSTAIQEEKTLELQRKRLDEDITSVKSQEHQYRVVLHEITEELSHLKFIADRVDLDETRIRDDQNILASERTNLDILQKQLSEHEQNLHNAREQLMNVESTVEGHHKTIASVNQQIPALEAEKNSAVTARDFKKAASASKDIKTLQQNKADSEAALEELKTKVVEYQSLLENADTKKAKLQTDLRKAEDDADSKRLQLLAQRERRLAARQSKLTSDLSAAFDGNGKRLTEHLQKEIECVDMELKWAQTMIRELRQKHSWPESYGAVPSSTSVDEPIEPVVESHVNDPSIFDTIVKSSRSSLKKHVPASPIMNGANGASLGLPTIRELTAPQSTATPSLSTLNPPKSIQYTVEDLDEARAELDETKSDLSAAESKLQSAIANEDYEAAAEHEESIAGLKSQLESLEATVKKIEQALPAEKLSKPSNENETTPTENTTSPASNGQHSAQPTKFDISLPPADSGLSLDMFADATQDTLPTL